MRKPQKKLKNALKTFFVKRFADTSIGKTLIVKLMKLEGRCKNHEKNFKNLLTKQKKYDIINTSNKERK